MRNSELKLGLKLSDQCFGAVLELIVGRTSCTISPLTRESPQDPQELASFCSANLNGMRVRNLDSGVEDALAAPSNIVEDRNVCVSTAEALFRPPGGYSRVLVSTTPTEGTLALGFVVTCKIVEQTFDDDAVSNVLIVFLQIKRGHALYLVVAIESRKTLLRLWFGVEAYARLDRGRHFESHHGAG